MTDRQTEQRTGAQGVVGKLHSQKYSIYIYSLLHHSILTPCHFLFKKMKTKNYLIQSFPYFTYYMSHQHVREA